MASDYSDDEDVNYSGGDIVWVKLGQCWWPGEVKGVDDVPEDVVEALRKMPLAFVKFFDEDQFEYVRNPNKIYPYSCSKKEEFIKKGLALARAKPEDKVMCKFSKDVVTAETRIGGNPNIVNDETVSALEEKVDYRDIFGDPSEKKKNKKDKEVEVKSKRNSRNKKAAPECSNGMAKASAATPPRRPITHPRFVSGSDHEVRIRQQPTTPPKEDNKSPIGVGNYKCQLCDFTSMRLNVIVLHTKAEHSESAITAKANQEAEKAKSSTKKKRARPSTTPTDLAGKEKRRKSETSKPKEKAKRKILANTENKAGKVPRSSAGNAPKVNKSPKPTPIGLHKGQKKTSKPKSMSDPEVREKLLADWDEEEEEEEVKEMEKLKKVIEMTLGQSSTEDSSQEQTEDAVLTEDTVLTEDAVFTEDAKEGDEETAEEIRERLEAVLAETSVPELPDLPNALCVETDSAQEKKVEVAKTEYDVQMVHSDLIYNSSTNEVTQEESLEGSEDIKRETQDLNPVTVSEVCSSDEMVVVSSASSSPLPQALKTEDVLLTNTKPEEAFLSDDAPLNYTQSALSRTSPSEDFTSDLKSEVGEKLVVSVPPNIALVKELPREQKGAEQQVEVVKKENYQPVVNDVALSSETDGDGSRQTYVLVTFGDSSSLQPSLDNLDNTTLLTLDGSQGVDEQGTRTLYIDPSTLGTNSELHNLLLAIDASEGSEMAQPHILDVPQQLVSVPGTASSTARAPAYSSIVLPNTPTTSVDAAKSAQDILAVALANTQVLQTADGSVTSGQPLLAQPPAVASVTNIYHSQQHQVMSPYSLTSAQSGALPLTMSSQQHQGRSGLPTTGALPSFSSRQTVSSSAVLQSANSGSVPVIMFQPAQDVHNGSLPVAIASSVLPKRSLAPVATGLSQNQKIGESGR